MNHARPFLLGSLAMAGLLAYVCGACANDGSGARACNVGADCASGACNSDGTCVAVGSVDGGVGDGAATDGASPASDGSVSNVDGSYDFDAGPGCHPNKDGTITHDEVPLGPGLKATYVVFDNSTGVTINTAGTKNADGTYAWDFTNTYAGDGDVIVQTFSPSGTYWAKDFAQATYSTKLAQNADLQGVFDYGATSLSLLGDVSPTSGATELTYATPIPILNFPFMLGSAWTTTSNATGTFQTDGTTQTIVNDEYNEKYETTVDKAGTVKTPFGTFNVLRVATLLTQTVDVLGEYTVTVTRTYAWVAECYGTVAKATSVSTSATGVALPPTPTPPIVDFTQAAELLRLSP